MYRALVAAALAWVLVAAAASAQSGPTLSAPTFVTCGTDVTVQGTGFRGQERIVVLAWQTQPRSDSGVEAARVTADTTGAFQAVLPGLLLASDCTRERTFAVQAVVNDRGKPGDALAEARVTFSEGQPGPATAGFGVPTDNGDDAHPLLIVLALAIGITLLRAKPWDGASVEDEQAG